MYVDETGVYPPEMTYFEPGSDEEWREKEGATLLQEYRIVLDPPRFRTLILGAAYDPEVIKDQKQRGVTWNWHREWFACKDKVASAASTSGI